MESQSLKPLLVIVGETASGKSALALDLAKRFNGEIVCADSRTVYRGMDIGTAKPSRKQQVQVKHHLLDIVEPNQVFSVAQFKRLALAAIEDISDRGKLPIMVGGTGLYIDSVLYDFEFAAPHLAGKRDPVNPRHLDKTVTSGKGPLRPNTLILGLRLDRELLKARITNRVDELVDRGVIQEINRLARQFGWKTPALQAPAYKAFRNYLEGTISLEEAKANFVKNDLHLAKRQRTWLKRNNSIQWVADPNKVVEIVTTFLNKLQY